MSNPRATGLGEPDPIGKKALFQPPKKRATTDKKSREKALEPRKSKPKPEPNGPRKPRKRVRIQCVEQADRLARRLRKNRRRDRAIYRAFTSLAGDETVGFLAFAIWRGRAQLLLKMHTASCQARLCAVVQVTSLNPTTMPRAYHAGAKNNGGMR